MLQLLKYAPVALAITVAGGLPTTLPSGHYSPGDVDYNERVADAQRGDAMRRARVWFQPAIPIERANLLKEPDAVGALDPRGAVACKWRYDEPMGGMNPKFDCILPNGEILRVKYAKKNDNDNAEIPAELAASRLLRVLGFGADRMYTVSTVRCFGCPEDPFSYSMQLFSPIKSVRDRFLEIFGRPGKNGEFSYVPDFGKYTDFSFVAIQRRMGIRGIRTENKEGWSWQEMQKIDPALGGSPRAERDGLILLAGLLSHTDNKAEQQRLVCLEDLDVRERCARPMAIIQDLGATFGRPFRGILESGEDRFNFEGWSKTPVWWEPDKCVVDLSRSLTGDFKPVQIGEEGRLFLARLLNRLSDGQIYDLFKGARADELKQKSEAGRDIRNWVEVFKRKRAEIANRPSPCPA
jgi:hypothetical protein